MTLSGGHPAVLSAPAAGNGSWTATLPAMEAGTGFTVTVTDLVSGATMVLTDVAFGDVLWCGGQSNLSGGNTPLAYAFNATEEIAAAANYPWIRLFTVGTPPGSPVPLADLASPPHIPWTRATPSAASRFSATCWFTGKRIADAVGAGVPLGLVESAWGGVSLQSGRQPATAPTRPNLTLSNTHPLKIPPLLRLRFKSGCPHHQSRLAAPRQAIRGGGPRRSPPAITRKLCPFLTTARWPCVSRG